MSLPIATFVNSVADFGRVVQLKVTSESSVLEFKKDLQGFLAQAPDERVKGQIEFCRDVSSFANTYGGCFLIGVDELRGAGANRGVAGSLHSLGDQAPRIQWMNEAIANVVVPKTFERTMVPLTVSDHTIIAVNVRPSLHLVSVWRDDAATIQCYRRTEHGKVAMNPDDVERHLMDASRAGRLALARAQTAPNAKSPMDIVPGVWVWHHGSSAAVPTTAAVHLHSVDEHQFAVWLPQNGSLVIAVPYSMLRSAWITVDGRIGIELSVRILFADGTARLESYS